MAINKRKILESAQKNLQRGAIDKALEDYRTLLKADPHDSNVLLKVGDLYLKQGRRDEAINAYVRVAQQFTREGFDAKAVALYKQISRLDPKRHDVCVPLADLYARMGLVGDAIASLQTAADAAYRAGEKDDALELLRRMAALDPSNTPNRLKVAELLAQEGRGSEALAEYDAVAEELERRGEAEERIRVIERILALDPERLHALSEVARAKLAASQFAGAKKLAERLVAAHPEDVDGFEILGHALLGAGETERARDVFRDLAERFRQRGDEDRARDLMQRFGGLEALAPDDAEAPFGGGDDGVLELETEVGGEDFLLDDEPAGPTPPPHPAAPARTPEPAPAAKIPLGRIEPVQAPRPKPSAAVAPAPPVSRPPARSMDPESTDPEQLMAEAMVYQRYGKHDRAAGALRAILAREPSHRPALEQLGEALSALGETEHAVTAWVRAAECATQAGDGGAFVRLRERVAALDAAAAAALGGRARAARDGPALEEFEIDLDLGDAPEASDATPPAASSRDGAVEVGDFGDVSFAGDEVEDPAAWSAGEDADAAPGELPEPTGESPAGAAPAVDEEPTATTPAQLAEQLEEAEFFLEQGLLDEARALYDRILLAAPNHPQATLRLGEIEAQTGLPSAPARAAIELGDFELELAEARSDASASPPESPPLHGSSRADVTAPSLADPPRGPAAAAEPGGGFDLAAELAGIGADSRTLAGTEEEAFDQVFHAFKSGVERELDPDDYEARYDLGIAYKEMGLFDDAIAEFRLAMEAPGRRLSCLHMMGLCALELGRAADAVAHLEQALSLPELPSDQLVPLRYDLGRAYAAQGDVARARAAFEQVRAADPGFGDLERELAGLASAAPAPQQGDDPAEAYESFDDLLAETSEAPARTAQRYESFDDLFAERREEREAAPTPEAPLAPADPVTPGSAVEPASGSDPLPEPAPEAELAPEPTAEPAPAPEPEPTPEPVAEPASAPAATRKRRKISFV